MTIYFAGISTVEIGGKLNEKKQEIERAFNGIISGFVLNGIRVLDLAADNDSNIVTDGAPEVVADLGRELPGQLLAERGLKSSTSEEEWRKVNKDWLDGMQHIDTTHNSQESTPATSDDLITASMPKCQPDDESCVLVDSSTSKPYVSNEILCINSSLKIQIHNNQLYVWFLWRQFHESLYFLLAAKK